MTSSLSSSMGGGIRPLPLCLLTPMGMGTRRKYSRRGQNPQHLKSWLFSVRQSRKRAIFRLWRHFRLHVRVFIASAEGASENVGYFAGGQLMTSSFSNSMGEASAPLPPLRVPMPMGACSLIRKFCFSQHLHPKFNFNKASPWNFLGQAQISH